VVPRRIDDTPENAVHFGLQTFYRKEFLQVFDAQMLLLEDNLKVAFKTIEPAVSLLKPPYESNIISRDVSSLIDLFPPNAKPDEASLEVMDHSPINQNFELNKSRQKFHHSLKEHHKISNIPKFRCKML
jgi:hypothetical protein